MAHPVCETTVSPKAALISAILIGLAAYSIAGCGSGGRSRQPVPTAPQARAVAPIDEATLSPTSSPVGTTEVGTSPAFRGSPSPEELQTEPGATTGALQRLVILHTNDNWGEAVPCG